MRVVSGWWGGEWVQSSAVLDGWYSRTTENEHSNGNNFDTRTIQGTEENEENRNKASV